jgi:uncharacterized protein (DUF2141 family)
MRLTTLILFSFISSIVYAQTLKITISGLRNNIGTVWLGFYTTNESFKKEQPLFFKTESKSSAVNGVLTITYSGLKPGTYGIALMDDENNNTQMDYGWFLPKEGFGFSNHYHTGMTRPNLSEFSFVFKDEPTSVQIKVRYL